MLREDFTPLIPGAGAPLTREIAGRLLLYAAFLLFVLGLVFSRVSIFQGSPSMEFTPGHDGNQEEPSVPQSQQTDPARTI